MIQMIQRLRALAPLAQGFLGALLVLVLYLAGSWTYARYNEFVVMRSVVSQIIQANQKPAPQDGHDAGAKK